MTLLIDNYDSFAYNLYQYIGNFDPDIKVVRNDALTVGEAAELRPDRIVLSPGPGRPEDAGIIVEAARTLGKTIPLLGVCLGHQAICTAFGAVVTYASRLMHGKQSTATLDTGSPLFCGLERRVPVARYHSLAADPGTMPECLRVTAVTDEDEIMAVEHREYPIFGVQFHPESILTPDGEKMIENFIKFKI